ncbi:MAG: LPS-assembly protein LptD [Burkholderiaceae bacterium]|jgi:LPS-assembly protein|nr:LPS-assembly protein LptD [Burkholderiaceae bacterium]
MVFLPAITRWYRPLPLVLTVFAVALPVYAQENVSSRSKQPRLWAERGLQLDYDAEVDRSEAQWQNAKRTAPLPRLPLRSGRGPDLAYQPVSMPPKTVRVTSSGKPMEAEKPFGADIATGKSRRFLVTESSVGELAGIIWIKKDVSRKKRPPPPQNDPSAPTILTAEQITGRPDREVNMDYRVEVEKGLTRLKGRHGIFRKEENEVDLLDEVDILRVNDRYRGDSATFNLDTGEGTMAKARYHFGDSGIRGTAERLDMEDSQHTRITNGTYTTCEGDNPDWYLSADTLQLDTAREIGQAKSPVLYLGNIPVLAATSISFPLSNERKSGFLPPTMGSSSRGGMEVMVPYYFNLAPNYDLTLSPRYISKRGLQMNALGRYLGNQYSGTTNVEYLPNDNDYGDTRYAISSKHQQKLSPHLSLNWDYNHVSDNQYPDDFSSKITLGQRLMTQSGNLVYSMPHLTATLGASHYEALQDKYARFMVPYDRMPFLQLQSNYYDVNGLDIGVRGYMARFWLDNKDLWQRDRGNRYVVQPEISLPLRSAGYFFTPKASLHYTRYDLDDTDTLNPANRKLSRSIPTFSLDGGLFFEKPFSFFGTRMKQTLEPRLFYVYTPYRDQRKYPVFDSGLPSFGYAQLFEENRFIGDDRISDSNNLAAAITTRFIEPSGAERMRFTVGQRYYFSDQRVGLYQQDAAENKNRSDLLLIANGMVTRELAVDAAVQYNQSTRHLYSANYSFQWRAGDKKLLNAEYRYLRDVSDIYGSNLDQVNVSGQWPLSKRVYAVGQLSYSLPDNKAIESLFGIEYNADCWIGRVVAQRYVTSTRMTSTSLFFQLELKGVAKIGSDPMEALRRTIPGYRSLTEKYK